MNKNTKNTVLLLILNISLITICLGCETECNKETVSNAEELLQSLKKAESGLTIEIKPGNYDGSFTVPKGINLIGKDKNGVNFTNSANDNPVFLIETGTENIIIKNITINADSSGGILTKGTGDLTLNNINVSIKGKYGINANELNKIVINNVSIIGNVTKNEMGTITSNPNSDKLAIVGILITNTKNCMMNDINISGVASVGIQLDNAFAEISDSEIHDSIGAGIIASGDREISIINTSINNIEAGATSFGFGIVAINNVHINTENIVLRKNALAGMLMDHATGKHTNLTVEENINRGVWVQFCEPKTDMNDNLAVKFDGELNVFKDNEGVSLGFYKTNKISMQNAEFYETKKLEMLAYDGMTGMIEVGDAIEIIYSNAIDLSNLVMDNNKRAGLLIDGNPELEDTTTDLPQIDISFNNVLISGNGDRGFVLQNGEVSRIGQGPRIDSDHLIQADEIGGSLEIPQYFELNIPFVDTDPDP